MSIYNREHRTRFRDVSTSFIAVAGDDPSADPLIAGRTKYTIFVQRIDVNVTTSAAQSWTFRDNNGTPKVIGVLPASAAVGHHVVLESEEGIPLTEGADLDMLASSAGVAGSCTVTAYMKPTGTMVPSQI
jgi:hypothetical protein